MQSTNHFFELDSNDPNTFGFRVEGRLETAAMADLCERIEQIRDAGGKARVIVDLAKYGGFELGVAREKLNHLRTLWTTIERLAYLVDSSWMSTSISLIDVLTPMHIRAFDHAHVDEAKAWLLGKLDTEQNANVA
ncbi:MAG: STAS/SEC14 domain-containing protein [Nannocystaceae bacterium]